MATTTLILTEFRRAVGEVSTTREPSARFLEHEGPEPFEKAPESGIESFYVDAPKGPTTTASFGVAGTVEREWMVDVHLGHPPFGTNEGRDDYVFRDLEKLGDILENRDWTTPGIQQVFLSESNVNKSRAEWWTSTMTFRVIYTDTMVTA